MSRWRRFWNALCSIKRIFRCCKRESFLPLTNCGGVNTDHRPRTIVTWNIQGLFYFIIPLYINDLAAAITLLKGNTLLYTLYKHLSSIIFVLCEKRSEPLLPLCP